MLKLVPKYQKGKTLPTPQQLQQAIDKKISRLCLDQRP